MLKVAELDDGTTVSEVDVQFMELSEIQQLMDRLQSELLLLAKEKKVLSTLPSCKKSQKTLKRLTKISTRLISIQEAVCWISRIKKNKRDTMAKEKAWLYSFYKYAQENLRQKQFDKFVKQTNIKMQYTIG